MTSYKRMFRYVASIAAVTLLLAACEKGKTGEEKKAEAGKGAAVLATVNGNNITVEDFAVEAMRLSPGEQQALADPENQKKFLETLVNKQVVIQEAQRKGVEKDPEVIKRLKPIKDELVWRQYIKLEVLDKAKVADKDVKDYFDKNKSDLGSIRLSHILVMSKQEAEEVLKKLSAGEDFAKLSREHSLDPKTKNSGGDLGYVNWLDFGSASLKDAAFKLKVGEIGNVVQSQAGYHIIKITDKKPAPDSEFDKVKDQVKELLLEKKKEEMFDSIVKGLKDKAKWSISPDAAKELAEAAQPKEQEAR
ncbi:MAG: peptidylprolyl isomerase [Nitrospirae bacterium]|nr:peptidylprolyl isomerase [Nitrospirota bacterium]